MVFADKKVKPEELSRAQNQLMSSVLMNLETRSMLCEDIGRQVCVYPPTPPLLIRIWGLRLLPQATCVRLYLGAPM